MYSYVCHTCQEAEVFDERTDAQPTFNEHAGRQHQVVLRRVETDVEPVLADPADDIDRTEDAAIGRMTDDESRVNSKESRPGSGSSNAKPDRM